jgi:predicted RNA binding protein YcfA (HicA-like mRNA interferase family)
VGKEKGFSLTSIRARDMRSFLERHGYTVEPGQHKHLKLHHAEYPDVLLPLRPGDSLSHPALKQIAAAMRLTPEQLTAAIRSRD